MFAKDWYLQRLSPSIILNNVTIVKRMGKILKSMERGRSPGPSETGSLCSCSPLCLNLNQLPKPIPLPSFRSLLCQLHFWSRWPWTLPSHSQLVHSRARVMLSPPSSLLPGSRHTSFIPLPLGCPLSLSQTGVKQEYDAGNIKLAFQKQFSWNSELSMIFKKRVSR